MRIKIPICEIAARANAITDRAKSRDPEAICKSLGIDIYYMDLKQKLKGYYFYQSRISSIVIDENVTPLFRPVLLAHELGHHALHRQTAMMKGFQEMEILEMRDSLPMETEANLFAAELLLEDERVLELLREYTFFETAAILNVPAALLDFKFSMLQKKGITLNNLGLGQANFLKKESSAYTEEKQGL